MPVSDCYIFSILFDRNVGEQDRLWNFDKVQKQGVGANSYVNAINTMHLITKKEILQDQDYRKLGMEQYLKEYAFDEQPFNGIDDFGAYILDIY